MKWPEIVDGTVDDRRMDWVYGKHPDCEALIMFCIIRYRPEAGSVTMDHDELDVKAMSECGDYMDEQTAMEIASNSSKFSEVLVDVFQAVGGLDWGHYCMGLVMVRNSFLELQMQLNETDEDKRAAVMLKKLELHSKLKPHINELMAFEQKFFGETKAAPREAVYQKYLKLPAGMEARSNG